jgi:hypothetical protein
MNNMVEEYIILVLALLVSNFPHLQSACRVQTALIPHVEMSFSSDGVEMHED